jgi:transcriptional regulator with XRE-family HTH domain
MPRRRQRYGPWDRPASPLQAARFEHRWTAQEVADKVKLHCPGHGDEECKLEADKLGEYERGVRRPGLDHLIALCKVYQRSAEDLGLVVWRDGSAPADDPETPADGVREPGEAPTEDAAVINGTMATIVGYPGGDVPSRLLALSGHDLAGADSFTGLAAPDWGEPEVTADVRRSTFIKGVGMAASTVITDPIIAIAQHTQAELAHTKVSKGQVDRLVEGAYEHARNYYRLTDAGLMDGLLYDWATAGRLLGLPATHRQRRDLFDTYARLCGILGFLYYERGELSRARVLLDTGQAAATEASNGDLLAWLIDRACLMVEHVENDPKGVLALSGQGLGAIGKATTLMSARIHCRMAGAHALLGDRSSAIASLRQAQASLESASGSCWPFEAETPRGFVYAPDLLAVDVGVTHLRLGDLATAAKASEEAAVLLREALGPRGAEEASVVPLNQLNLAMVLVRSGEVEGACTVATDAIVRYEGVAKAAVIRRARQFERMVLSQPSTPRSRELSELLHDREPRPTT